MQNVVWVTLESTRYDHTSLSGYRRDTTPELDRIASLPRGRSFDACFSHGIWTLASTASLLTGTVPSHHATGMRREVLPDELATVPELLKAAGYRTACLSPNPHLSSDTNLDRGFEEFRYFDLPSLVESSGVRPLLSYLLRLRKHSAGYTRRTQEHCLGYLLNAVAKSVLADLTDAGDPAFLYLHHGDPHRPYSPPLPYRDRYTDEIDQSVSEAFAFSHHSQDNLYEDIAAGCPYTTAQWDGLEAMYDSTIRYTDRLVGDLFEFTQTLDGETIFVVTADHGELFGEHGIIDHKLVAHDAVAHVPMVVHGLDAACDHDGELIQHNDVMRTILSALGIDESQLQGRHLGAERREYALIQRGEARYERNVDKLEEHGIDPAVRAALHDGTLHALRTTDYKYLQSRERAALFEVGAEGTDVSDQYPETVDRLEEILQTVLTTDGEPVTNERVDRDLSEARKDQLAELGYLVE
jgi:uncharacterized sulfatase